ncbi:hypothetical protein ACX0G7_12170 [Flavitalea antarctica]
MKYMLLLVVFSGLISTSKAQGVNFIISYPIAFPMGNTSDYVGKTSFRGFSFEVNGVHEEKWEYGLETTWNVFYQKEESKVYTRETASIKGVQFRYVNSVPILAQARMSFGDEKAMGNFTPFAGLGIGTIYVNQSTDFGMYRFTNEAWQFCLRPELGVKFNNSKGPGGFLGVRYYAGFNSDDMDGQSYLSVNVGIIFPSGR